MRYGAVRYTITYGAVQLCYFVGDFSVVFTIYVVWWIPLLLSYNVQSQLKLLLEKSSIKFFFFEVYDVYKKI